MKHITILALTFTAYCFSQSVEITKLEKPPGTILYEPGINTNKYVQNEGGNIYAYNYEFDGKGKFISNSNFCLDINDVPLKNGFLEYIDKPKTGSKGWYYTTYNQSEEPKFIDLKSVVGKPNGEFSLIYSMPFLSDYFIAEVDNTYYRISEDFEVKDSFTTNSTITNNDIVKQIEVLQDGCLYVIYFTKTGFKLEKIDIANKTQLAIDIPLPKGMNFKEAFPYAYRKAIMANPDSYYLSINQDGSKVFFGFCPGKSFAKYTGDGVSFIKSTQANFYILNGKDFSVEAQYVCKFPDEQLELYKNSEEGIRNTYIEDVCFFNEDIYVVLTSFGQNGVLNSTLEDGETPQAIYKISTSQKKVILHGIVVNKYDDVLTKKRDHGKIIVKDNKMFLIYPTQMNENKKTYQTIHVVDVTDPEFKINIIKEGLENFKPEFQSHINFVSGTQLSDGSLLYLAYNIAGMYRNLSDITYAIKVTLN